MTERAAGHAEGVERDAAWLAVAQSLAARASHDVKNALNGIAVNLEVVRARAERGAGAEKIAPFATAAAGQLEGAVGLVEALLALGRPARAPADLGGVGGAVRAVAALVATTGHPVALDDGTESVPAIDGVLLRLLIAAALLAVADGSWENAAGPVEGSTSAPSREGGAGIECRVRPDRGGNIRVYMRGARPAAMSPAVLRLAVEARVTVTPGADGIELTIPAAEIR